jgi:uncharacterized protein
VLHNLERRHVGSDNAHWRDVPAVQFRAAANGSTSPGTVRGYSAVFNTYSSNLGGFVEQVKPEAFNRTLKTASVLATMNHNFDLLLARRDVNMQMGTDDRGLWYEIELPDTAPARDLAVLTELGIIRGSSFMFRVTRNGADWSETDQGMYLRSLTDVELIEHGPVAIPAYLATEEGDFAVALRSLADELKLSVTDILDARRAGDAVFAEFRAAHRIGQTIETSTDPDESRTGTTDVVQRVAAPARRDLAPLSIPTL